MSRQCDNLTHARIPPNHDLVQRISVRAHNFIAILRPCQIANLAARVDAGQADTAQGIPEPDATVGSTTTAGKKAVLMR